MIFNIRKNINESATEDMDSMNDITTDERDENILIDSNDEENNAPEITCDNIQTEGASSNIDIIKVDSDDEDCGYTDSLAFDPNNIDPDDVNLVESTILTEKYGFKRFLNLRDYAPIRDRKDPEFRNEVKNIIDGIEKLILSDPDYKNTYFNLYNITYKSLEKIKKKTINKKIPAARFIINSTKDIFVKVFCKNLYDYLVDNYGFTRIRSGNIASYLDSNNTCCLKQFGNNFIIFESSVILNTYQVDYITYTYYSYAISFKCVANTDYTREYYKISESGNDRNSSRNSIVLNEKYGFKKLFNILDHASKADCQNASFRSEMISLFKKIDDVVCKNDKSKDKSNIYYKISDYINNNIIESTNEGIFPKNAFIIPDVTGSDVDDAKDAYMIISKVLKGNGFKSIGNKLVPKAKFAELVYKVYGDNVLLFGGTMVDIGTSGSPNVVFECTYDFLKNNEYTIEKFRLSESTVNLSSNDEDDFNTCEDNDECIEKEKMTPENLYCFDDHLTDCDDTKDEDITEFRGNPEVMQFFTEYYDITNRATRRKILSLTEAEQNAILTSITSKLYDKIVAKTDDIDYGEIPNTKGDITKLSNYKGLIECIDIIRELVVAMKQDTAPIDILTEAIANISARKDLFERGFRTDSEVAILMYNNYVLAIVASVSLLISTSIEFIKTPNKESFDFVLDKMAYTKNKNYIFFSNLKKFNKACKNGDLDKSINSVIDVRTKHEAAAIAGIGLGGKIAIGLGIAAGSVGLLLLIPNLLKEIVFVFYHLRVRASDYFNTQADLLEMNAYRVANNTEMDQEKKNRIVEKQTKKVGALRKIANFFSIKFKKAEVDTNKEIAEDAKTKNTVDNSPELANTDTATNSALF